MLPSLCKIAWEWFFSVGKLLFFERWERARLFLPVLCARGWGNRTGKKSFAQRGKKQVLRAVAENH